MIILSLQDQEKKQEKRNAQKAYDDLSGKKDFLPPFRKSPDHEENGVNQQETKDRTKDKEECARKRSNLENRREQFFALIEFK